MTRLKPLVSVTFTRCTEENKKYLIEYKPVGADNSITREYILNPYIYEPLMKFIPENLAPNVITLSGFLCILVSAIVTFIFCPTFSEPIPRWLFLLNAVLLFSYQTLDNMDGKQARKTQTSSGLGELFDHGVDSLATTVAAIAWLCVCGQGATLTTFIINIISILPFFFATWEEYYIGGLFLGKINGPIEGVLGFVFVQILGAIFGYEFFHYPIIFGMPFWLLFSLLTFSASCYTSIMNIVTVSNRMKENKLKQQKGIEDETTKSPNFETSILRSFTTLIPFFILLITYYTIIVIDKETVARYPYIFLICEGVGFGYLASNLTLAYLLKKSTASFSWVLVPPLFYLINLIAQGPIPSSICLFICLIFTISLHANYVLSVCDDICNVLDINVLSIKKKNKQQ
ncbi:hypothetical protein ABK040_010363 [Willaertia magna]